MEQRHLKKNIRIATLSIRNPTWSEVELNQSSRKRSEFKCTLHISQVLPEVTTSTASNSHIAEIGHEATTFMSEACKMSAYISDTVFKCCRLSDKFLRSNSFNEPSSGLHGTLHCWKASSVTGQLAVGSSTARQCVAANFLLSSGIKVSGVC
jgi:hypothetical protein